MFANVCVTNAIHLIALHFVPCPALPLWTVSRVVTTIGFTELAIENKSSIYEAQYVSI